LKQQVAITVDGEVKLLGEGQHNISHKVNLQADPSWKPGDVRVQFAEKDVAPNKRAAEVLANATHIIIAPGHTFGTILPTLALPALSAALAKSDARLIVVMTLLTTPHQTTGWSGEDFISVYESYIGRPVDVVVANSGTVPLELVEGQDWVRFSAAKPAYTVVTEELAQADTSGPVAGDVVPRAVVIHSPDKIRAVLRGILMG